MNDRSVSELVTELIVNMKGLRKEIEGWRVHTSSGSTFVLDVLDKQLEVIEALKEKLK
jgi:hypothetical protein